MFKRSIAVVVTLAMALGLLVGCSGTGDVVSTEYGRIKLGQYTDLVVYEDDVEITDDELQEQIDYILSQYTETETLTEGTIDEDTTAIVDYKGKIKIDGKKVAIDEAAATDQSITPEDDAGNYIDGFADAIVGHEVGDKFTVKLQFPDSYTGTASVDDEDIELAGMDVWFTFEITGISETITPDLDEDFVTTYFSTYGLSTVDEFTEYVETNMRQSNISEAILDTIIDDCEVVSYDTTEKESLVDYINEYYESMISSYYSTDLDSYLEAASMSSEEWESNVTSQAEESLKEKMVFLAIAKVEGLELSSDEYDTEGETLAAQYSMTLEELESYYGEDEVEYALVYQKVLEFICDNVDEQEGSAPTTTVEETTTVAEEETDTESETEEETAEE